MKQQDYFVQVKSAADAVAHAQETAREEGHNAATVAKVVYVERPKGWVVTLVLR